MSENSMRVILSILLSATLQAQTPDRTTVFISLESRLCERVMARAQATASNCKHQIGVVYNENDEVWPACLEPAPPCTWKWTTNDALHPGITTISLRLGDGIGRTPCRRLTESSVWTHRVRFTRTGSQPAFDIDIDGPGVWYVREVNAVDHGDVACNEKKLLAWQLENVQFSLERLRLQVYRQKDAFCGVIINDTLSRETPAQDTEIVITPADLAQPVRNQSLEGKLCYAPTSIPIEVIQETMRKSNPTFSIKVK